MPQDHLSSIGRLRSALDDLDGGRLDLDGFLAVWRSADSLISDLPPRFKEVLDGTLMRLESSRLFSGDSCSFSRSDLTGNLRVWLDKAEARLTGQASPS